MSKTLLNRGNMREVLVIELVEGVILGFGYPFIQNIILIRSYQFVG